MWKITIPQYPRRVKIAEARKEKYYLFNGISLSCGKKQLPVKYFQYPVTEEGYRPCSPRHLKLEYTLGVYAGSKLLGWYKRDEDGNYLTYRDKDFSSDAKVYLIEADSKKRVLANPLTAGTPRWARVNFQDLYSGNMNQFTRAKMMQELKDFFRPYIADLPVIENYPLRMTLEIVDTVKNIHDNSKDGDYGQAFDVDNRGIIYFKCLLDLLVSEGKIKSDDRMYVTQAGGALFTPLPTNNDDDRCLILHIDRDDREVITHNQYYKNFKYELQPDTRGIDDPW